MRNCVYYMWHSQRAKEKLILTGTVKKIEDYQAVQAEAQDWQEEKLPYGMREGARCYWDWIFPALAGANEEFPVQILEMEHLITVNVTDREDRVRREPHTKSGSRRRCLCDDPKRSGREIFLCVSVWISAGDSGESQCIRTEKTGKRRAGGRNCLSVRGERTGANHS